MLFVLRFGRRCISAVSEKIGCSAYWRAQEDEDSDEEQWAHAQAMARQVREVEARAKAMAAAVAAATAVVGAESAPSAQHGTNG